MRRIANLVFKDPDTDEPYTIPGPPDKDGRAMRKLTTTALLLRIVIRQSDYKQFGAEAWEKQFLAHRFNEKLGPHLKEPPAQTEILMEEDQYKLIRELVEKFEQFKFGTDYVPFKQQIFEAVELSAEVNS